MAYPRTHAGVVQLENLIFIVDDEQLVREATEALLGSVGYKTKSFAGAEEFLAFVRPDHRGCVVTDVRMKGMNGLDLQDGLTNRGIQLPVIVVTAHPTTQLTVRAIKNGAVTLLEKPYEEQQLFDAVQYALKQNAEAVAGDARRAQIAAKLDLLTEAERQVLLLIAGGSANKQIAFDLGVSLRTVESRRHKIFEKLEVDSVAMLVRLLVEARQLDRSA